MQHHERRLAMPQLVAGGSWGRTSPASTPACTAAPSATTSSGFTLTLGSFFASLDTCATSKARQPVSASSHAHLCLHHWHDRARRGCHLTG